MLILLLAVAATSAYAQQPVGEMELEQGRVKIRHLSEDRIYEKLGERVPVYQGDVLQSAHKTRAKVYFRGEKDVVSLYSNTLFRVNVVSEQNTFFGLNIGKALFKVLSRFRNNKFNVKTPTATIGVKGTEFVTGSDGQKTFVLTLTGTVAMANIDFPERQVLVTKNQASHVEPKKLPSPPVQVPPATQEQIVTQEGVEQFEEIPFQAPPPAEPGQGDNSEEKSDEQKSEEQQTEEGEVPADTTVEAPDIPEDTLAEVLDQIDQVAEVQDAIQDSTEAVSAVDDPGLPEETSGPLEVNIKVTR